MQVGDQGFQIKDDIARGNLVWVQEVVDYLQELLAGRENLVQVGDIIRQARIIGVSQQHFTVTDDGVQGRPQFMAQMGPQGLWGSDRHQLLDRKRSERPEWFPGFRSGRGRIRWRTWFG